MRIIDADKLIADMESDFSNAHYPTYYTDIVDAQPTINAKPVIHGRWKKNGLMMECSSCGLALVNDEKFNWLWNYCPNCGADMREVEQ